MQHNNQYDDDGYTYDDYGNVITEHRSKKKEDPMQVTLKFYKIIRDKRLNEMFLPHYVMKSLKTFRYFTRWIQGMYPVNRNKINTEYKLAKFVYDKVGYGEFGICIGGRFLISKTFNPNFICTSRTRSSCKRYLTNNCRKMHDQKLIKRGMSCWMNKYRVHARVRRAIILIKEGFNTNTGDDFIYSFDKEAMEMYKFPFWKGRDEGIDRSLRKEEYYVPNRNIFDEKEFEDI